MGSGLDLIDSPEYQSNLGAIRHHYINGKLKVPCRGLLCPKSRVQLLLLLNLTTATLSMICVLFCLC